MADFPKLEIFDTADKQKLQKAITTLRKERRESFSQSNGNVGSPRQSEGGSGNDSSSQTSSVLKTPISGRSTSSPSSNGTPRRNTQIKNQRRRASASVAFETTDRVMADKNNKNSVGSSSSHRGGVINNAQRKTNNTTKGEIRVKQSTKIKMIKESVWLFALDRLRRERLQKTSATSATQILVLKL